IDEIGKMELFNPEFRETVLAALNSSFPVVATVLAKPHPFCDALKRRRDVRLIEVNRANREKLPEELYNLVMAHL
ncbi:MAG: nucleoside-triphosphatase, partial [Desulfotomaculales bacterium]